MMALTGLQVVRLLHRGNAPIRKAIMSPLPPVLFACYRDRRFSARGGFRTWEEAKAYAPVWLEELRRNGASAEVVIEIG